MQDYLIGVDIGTQGTKTVLYDRTGHAAAAAFQASRLIQTAPGVLYEEPDDILKSVTKTISAVMQQSGVDPLRVAAISMDGQMAGIMGIDQDWQAVTPYDSWLDTRCEPYINLMKQQAGDQILLLSGCPVTYDHGPKILWWKNEQPDAWRRIKKFIQPAVYAAGWLAGLKADQAYLDDTYLHFSGFGNNRELCWSDDLLDHFAVDRSLMPRIVRPWEVIGRVTRQAAATCGLVEGIPIAAGCGDQAATALGAGITEPGQVFDVAGTASVFSCCTDRYAPDLENKTLLYPRSVLENTWQPMAYINGGGLCLRWLRDQLGEADYESLSRLAEQVLPGCSDLFFLPHFNGRVCPNQPDLRGAYLGLTFAHEKGALYRAILEAIACEYAIFLNILKRNLPNLALTEVRVIGGGARSALFNQIKSDMLNLPYESLQIADTAPLGSALLAARAIGLTDNLRKPVFRLESSAGRWRPDSNNHQQYQTQLHRYEQLLSSMNVIYQQGKG